MTGGDDQRKVAQSIFALEWRRIRSLESASEFFIPAPTFYRVLNTLGLSGRLLPKKHLLAVLLSSSQIHGLHTRLNILGKQSNRGSGGIFHSYRFGFFHSSWRAWVSHMGGRGHLLSLTALLKTIWLTMRALAQARHSSFFYMSDCCSMFYISCYWHTYEHKGSLLS